MSRFEHHTGELRDYSIDWERHLDPDGDTISTSAWAKDSEDAAMLVASTSKTTTVATVWLNGGTDGKTTKLTNTVVTAGGRTLKQSISVVCRDP